jgi:transposase
MLKIRQGVWDAEWSQMRTLRALGMSVTEIAHACQCKSRCVVYQALANDTPPSQRLRYNVPKRKRQPRIKTRRAEVKRLIKKTVTVHAKKILKVRGRPRKDGAPRGTYTVTKEFKKLVYPSPAAVARQLTRQGTPVSRATVARDLKAVNFKCYSRPVCPFLTPAQKTARLAFCRETLKRDADFWSSIIFTDEKWFDANDNGAHFQYWERGKQMSHLVPREFTQSAAKCFVWGAISLKWRIIVVVKLPETGGMTSKEFIEQCVSQLKKKCLRNKVLMQDGAKVHWTSATRAALSQTGVSLLTGWPAGSPDINPIERVWAELSRRVADRGPYGAEELCAYVVAEFNALTQGYIADVVMSFRNRLRECVAKGGSQLNC